MRPSTSYKTRMPRKRHIPADQPALRAVRGWFLLTDGERRLVAGILAIFLVGLVARRAHLRRLESEPVPAPGAAGTGIEWGGTR